MPECGGINPMDIAVLKIVSLGGVLTLDQLLCTLLVRRRLPSPLSHTHDRKRAGSPFGEQCSGFYLFWIFIYLFWFLLFFLFVLLFPDCFCSAVVHIVLFCKYCLLLFKGTLLWVNVTVFKGMVHSICILFFSSHGKHDFTPAPKNAHTRTIATFTSFTVLMFCD